MRWGRGRCASRDPVARGTEARTPRSLWWLSRRRPPRFPAGGCGKPSPRSRRQRGPGTARQAWRSMSRSRGESCAEGCEERRGRCRQGRCPCFSRSCLLEIGGMARARRAHGSSRGGTRAGCRGAGAWERLPRRCRRGSGDVEPAGDRAVQGVAQILRRSVPRGDRAVPASTREGAGTRERRGLAASCSRQSSTELDTAIERPLSLSARGRQAQWIESALRAYAQTGSSGLSRRTRRSSRSRRSQSRPPHHQRHRFSRPLPCLAGRLRRLRRRSR